MKAIETTESLPSYQDKLIEERDELVRKRNKLIIFLESGAAAEDADLLKTQLWAMTTYLLALNARVDHMQSAQTKEPAQVKRLSEHGLTLQDLGKC